MRINRHARAAVGAEPVLRFLPAKEVALERVFAFQVHNVGTRGIDVHVAIAGADAAVAGFDFVLVERRQMSFEFDSSAMAVAEIPSIISDMSKRLVNLKAACW